MKNDIEIVIEKNVMNWVEHSLPMVTAENPVSIDLDQLQNTKNTKQIVPGSIFAFVVLVKTLIHYELPVKPILTIPLLETANQFTYATPHSLQDMEKQLHDLELPSLYLLHWGPRKWTPLCEELNIPLPFKLMENQFTDNTYVYYREFRYGRRIQLDCEFSRVIYAEYYPDGVKIQ